MAGTETKRIIELTEASTVQSGDFIAVDSNARGTKKVPTSALATSAALTAETNARAGADEAEAQAREAADNTLGGQVADLKSDISEYDAKFKRNEWVATKLETSDSITIETYTNRNVNTSSGTMLTLETLSGFYSYCFTASSDMAIAANVDASYYAIGVLVNPNAASSVWRDSGGILYKVGESPARYRASDNNLPTQSSPLAVTAGTVVVVTVNSSSIPYIDILNPEFIDIPTSEDMDEAIGTAIDELLNVEETFVGCNLDNTTKFTVDKKTGRSASTTTIASNPAVTLDAYDAYCSYCFAPTEDVVIAGMAEGNTYYAITTLTNPNYTIWQVSGTQLWNNGSAASRKRKSESNLPTENSPLTVSAGTIVVVTVKTGESAHLLIKETAKDAIKPALLKEASPYIDVEMHSGYFYYYIPTKNGKYLRYKFVHFVDSSSNADGWVQRVVDLVPPNKVGVLMSVVRDGEWEMAIKLKDRPDFIGTMNHGSEIATVANLYFDGVKTDVTDGTNLSCKEIRVNQKSTMYDPNDETTVVGYHYKTHFITADGVRIEQRIEWITDQTLDISYCGMLPATRGNDSTSSVQVTDHAYDNKTYTEYGCATTTLDSYLTAFTYKGDTFYLRGDTSEISMSLKCDMENAPNTFTFLSNSVYYNKVYFAHNNTDYQVSSGDEWKWVSIYKIEYAGN